MNYVFGYGRSSTQKQVITIDAQKRACESWFQIQKDTRRFDDTVEWGGWYEDRAVSSDAPWFEREAGDILLSRLHPGDFVVVSMYDRAFRSLADCATSIQILADKHVKIIILDTPEIDTTTANGALVVNLLAVIKEHEKRIIKERAREARVELLRTGRPTCGQAPTGYKIIVIDGEKRLTPCPHDRKVFDLVADLRDNHKMAWEKIYWELVRQRIRRADGSQGGITWIKLGYKSRKQGYPLSQNEYVQKSLSLLAKQGRVVFS